MVYNIPAAKNSILRRSVSARLVERFIFNFRLAPDALRIHLPVSWLHPQVINGSSVVSFCILRVKGLMLSPLPSFLGIDTVSCAYRCGVIDVSELNPGPSVYIVGRNTDLATISRLGPVIFRNPMPRIRAALAHEPDHVDVSASHLDGSLLFSAKVKPSKTPDRLHSQVFDSLDDYVKFIHDGTSSYAPSIYDSYYSRVDLLKEDSDYEAVEATVGYSWLDSIWRDAGLAFDSAVRAGGGGLYRWTYLGLTPTRLPSFPLSTYNTMKALSPRP